MLLFRRLAICFMVVAVVGLGLVAAGIDSWWRFRDAATTTGTVIDVRTEPARHSRPLYRAQVRWTDLSGQTHTFWSSATSTAAPMIGSTLTVWYLPGDPDSAREAVASGHTLMPWVGVVLAVGFGVGGAALWHTARRRRRPTAIRALVLAA